MEVPGRGEGVEGSWGGMVTGASTSSPLPTARQPLDTQARCVQTSGVPGGCTERLERGRPALSSADGGALGLRWAEQGSVGPAHDRPCRDWHVSVAPRAAAQPWQARHLSSGGR